MLFRVQLAEPNGHSYVTSDSVIQDLDTDLGKEGSLLPVCQRQLLCIARALLQDCTKLVILEEANLNQASETKLKSVIAKEFEESVIKKKPCIHNMALSLNMFFFLHRPY